MSTATILHADLDAFYASVEQLLNPTLRGLPIAVGGGVVLAASYEARAFGVKGGMAGKLARELCPQLRFVSGHFDAYQRLGDQAMRVIGDFTPLVERISIDEAFADVAGTAQLFGSPRQVAETIRARVRDELGLPISVGVAHSKHLAKIASQVAKPDGLVVVPEGEEADFLAPLPVGLMWGVGPATEARLGAAGIRTIGALGAAEPAMLRRLIGEAAGEKLYDLAADRDPRRVITDRRARSAGAQAALGRRAAEAGEYMPVLRQLADRIGSRLRRKELAGRRVTVRVRFGDFRAVTRAITLPAPVAATTILAEIAEELVLGLLAEHRHERVLTLVGIAVSQLERQPLLQLELPLALPDQWRRPGAVEGAARWTADRAVDAVRERFGFDAIGYGAAHGTRRGVPDAFRTLAEKPL